MNFQMFKLVLEKAEEAGRNHAAEQELIKQMSRR